jgi:hypothetical protein
MKIFSEALVRTDPVERAYLEAACGSQNRILTSACILRCNLLRFEFFKDGG